MTGVAAARTPPQPNVPTQRPEPFCDVVMKGGITSGVVYPHAVCELAAAYRLRNVGGTSAGAIAAAAAAAAEYGRATGGYDELADLPTWIGTDGNLANLFQPQKTTCRLHALLLAAISHKRGKPLWIGLAAARQFFFTMLLGALPGAALVYLAIRDGRGALEIAAIAGGIVIACGGAVLTVAARAAWIATRHVASNKLGLCSGMPGHRSKHLALTPWLADLIDGAAGRTHGEDDEPLTFGHLWAGPEGDPAAADPDAPWMRLEMMTTNVTNHRAERWPSASREYFFSPQEFRELFPERVVRWMIANPPPFDAQPARTRRQQLRRQQLLPLRPLPHPADLPVIVATRMSLSFPVLLSAVPLWRVDFSRKANQDAAAACQAWLGQNAAEWDAAAEDDERRQALAGARPRVKSERCWFSDGGISSNFPVHFFDTLLPGHPTVGLNLRDFHPDGERSDDEAENVWMPDRHNAGILDWWYRFDDDLVGFLGNVVRTMQNRVDDAQMRAAGYRDRVVHVSLTDTEGGMNLKMDPKVIQALTARGRAAGQRLVARFGAPVVDPGDLSWDDHRWVRLRIALLAMSDALGTLAQGYVAAPTAPALDFVDLLSGPAPPKPTSYEMNAQQRAKADALMKGVQGLVAELEAMPGSLAADAPAPPPALRPVAQDPAPKSKVVEVPDD